MALPSSQGRAVPDAPYFHQQVERQIALAIRASKVQRLESTWEHEHEAHMAQTVLEIAAKLGVRERVSRAQEIEIVRTIIQNHTPCCNWRTLRAAAIVAGEACECDADERDVLSSFLGFLDVIEGDNDLAVAAARALVVGPSSARAATAVRIRRLLKTRHPQAKWELARSWPVVAAVLAADHIDETDALLQDRWVRRRLLQSFIINSSMWPASRSPANAMCRIEIEDESGLRFLSEFELWAALRLGRSLTPYLPRAQARVVEEAAHGLGRLLYDVRRARQSSHLTEEVLTLDSHFFCLDLDLEERQNKDSANDLAATGRYSRIENYVRRAAAPLKGMTLAGVLTRLSHSLDEGVRWAVARFLESLSPLDVPPDARYRLLARLVSDEHPWVLREAMLVSSASWEHLADNHRANLVTLATESTREAISDGWSPLELNRGLLQLLQRDPRMLRLYPAFKERRAASPGAKLPSTR